MEFFCYHRDRAGSIDLRRRLGEAHWAYMDGYGKELIARGPVFAEDGGVIGSVHVVELPDPAAARAFAFEEPNWQAGVYRDVMLRRWRNLLGRTMWEFPGGRPEEGTWLVVGLYASPVAEDGGGDALPGDGDALIAYGPLLSDDGDMRLGTAALVAAEDGESARTLVEAADGPGKYASVEAHAWTFGGRR